MGLAESLTLILSIVNALGLTFGGIWLRRESKRLKNAEAAQVETNSAIAAGNEWQEIAAERGAEKEKLNNKIDSLYKLLESSREKYNQLLLKYTEVQVELATMKPRICNKPGCTDREPQSGF